MKKDELIKLTSNITRNSCPKHINFHCHTTFSDGSLNPEQLLDEAFKNKIKYLSITDHHTLKAHKYIAKKKLLKKYPINSIKLVSGIEISCLLSNCLVHILGLGINLESIDLNPYTKGQSPHGNFLKAKTVSQAIKDAGGLSFLAHPGRYRVPFNILIPEAYKNNIDGIEVWYDYSMSEKWQPSYFICEKIDLLTDKFNMLKTCGTDSHGYSLLGR